MPCCSSNLRRSSEVAGFFTRRRGLTARTEQRRRAKWNSQYGPNLPGGPNPVPTSSGGWGHEKLFKINGVPNLTPWSQPFAIHSCGRTKNVGKTLFYTKRVGPPLGTPRLGPHSIKPLICSGKTLSQPLRRLGPHAARLGPGAIGAGRCVREQSAADFTLAASHRMLHLSSTKAEGPQL